MLFFMLHQQYGSDFRSCADIQFKKASRIIVETFMIIRLGLIESDPAPQGIKYAG